MRQILFTTKQDNKRSISEQEIIKIFEGTEDLDRIKKAVEMTKDRIFASWASVEIKDKAGELIPIDDIIKQQDMLLERNGPISDEHTNRIIGTTLAYKVLEHPKTNTLGVLHLNKIFNHHEFDDKIWSEIVSGQRKGSSVGGFNTGLDFGTDKVTGEPVKILEGFHQFETASVEDPCNPMALNEAFSVIAKSNKSLVQKPFAEFKDFNDCVRQQLADGKSEESAKKICGSIQARVEGKSDVIKQRDPAAVCGSIWFEGTDEQRESFSGGTGGRGRDEKPPKAWFDDCLATIGKTNKVLDLYEKSETNINKATISEDINNHLNKTSGDKMTEHKEDEEEENEISKLRKENETLKAEVSKLSKRDIPEKEEMEEEEKAGEPKLIVEPDQPAKIDDEKERESKTVHKEEARSDIEGEASAPAPESPEPDDSNEEDAFKKNEVLINKKFEAMKTELVNKFSTPRMGMRKVTKSQESFQNLPLQLAMGKKRMPFHEVNKANNDYADSIEGGAF